MTDYSLRELITIGEHRQYLMCDQTARLQETIARCNGNKDFKAAKANPYSFVRERYLNGIG